MSKEVLVQDEPGANEVMSPEDLAEIMSMSGAGLETVTAQDLSLPFLYILQSNSPEVNPHHAKFVEDARIGKIYNTATGACYDKVTFVPAKYLRRYTEWKPRDAGGGLIRDWGTDSSMYDKCPEDERRRRITPAGNDIVMSATIFGHIWPTQERAIIAFNSTQLKKARNWLTMASNERQIDPKDGKIKTPPFCFRSYVLSTVPESNEKGDWMGWKITPHLPTIKVEGGRDLILESLRFLKDIDTEKVVVKAEQLTAASGEAMDKNIPF